MNKLKGLMFVLIFAVMLVGVSAECVDSDNGKNYFEKGTTFELTDSYAYKDSCNGNVLTEYFCSSGSRGSVTYNCPNGCSNGVCMKEVPGFSCVDSDNGLDKFTAGKTTVKYGDEEFVHEDGCFEAIYCELISATETEKYSNQVNSCSNPVDELEAEVGDCFVCGGKYEDEYGPCEGEDCFVNEAYCFWDETHTFVDADADKYMKCEGGCSNSACAGVVSGEIKPMIIRQIKEVKSVNPSDVANLAFLVLGDSGGSWLGSYHFGEWDSGSQNVKCSEKKIGPLLVEFSWERGDTDVVVIDSLGRERKIYLPANKKDSSENEYFWIAEDGSSYYADIDYTLSWYDLDYKKDLVPENLARKSLSSDQVNPAVEEPLVCGFGDDYLTVRGKVVNSFDKKPIYNSYISSGYEMYPEEVRTDGEGNFEVNISSKYEGYYSFYSSCYEYSNFYTKNDYEVLENEGTYLVDKYDFALIKEGFDRKRDVLDVSGLKTFDLGNIEMYPVAHLFIISDLEAEVNVMYKMKTEDYYNGPGQGGYTNEHYLSNVLPLDYDVHIEFTEEDGTKYNSTIYHVPINAVCGTVSLKYVNGKSEWSLESIGDTCIDSDGGLDYYTRGYVLVDGSQINDGCIESDDYNNGWLREITCNKDGDFQFNDYECPNGCIDGACINGGVSCTGCSLDSKCYPFGYRKDGNYCSDNQEFVSQILDDSVCENSFECASNLCVDGYCVEQGLFGRILNWFRNLFS